MIAAAFMNPRTTGCETKLTMLPSLTTPRSSWIRPTSRVRSKARPIYSSVCGMAKGMTAAAVMSDAMATGPVASCRDEPQSAPMIAGTKAV